MDLRSCTTVLTDIRAFHSILIKTRGPKHDYPAESLLKHESFIIHTVKLFYLTSGLFLMLDDPSMKDCIGSLSRLFCTLKTKYSSYHHHLPKQCLRTHIAVNLEEQIPVLSLFLLLFITDRTLLSNLTLLLKQV